MLSTSLLVVHTQVRVPVAFYTCNGRGQLEATAEIRVILAGVCIVVSFNISGNFRHITRIRPRPHPIQLVTDQSPYHKHWRASDI